MVEDEKCFIHPTDRKQALVSNLVGALWKWWSRQMILRWMHGLVCEDGTFEYWGSAILCHAYLIEIPRATTESLGLYGSGVTLLRLFGCAVSLTKQYKTFIHVSS